MQTQPVLPKVLMLNVAGQPQEWISYSQSATYYAKDKVAWSAAQMEYELRGGTNSKTGLRSTMTINTIIAIKGKISAKAMENANRIGLENPALFARDRQMCAYCGKRFSTGRLSRDHVIPTSRGGANQWTNCVTSCKPCNKAKDNYLLEEIDMSLLYVPYRPTKAEFLILDNRNILADQMEFLLKHVPDESPLLRDVA